MAMTDGAPTSAPSEDASSQSACFSDFHFDAATEAPEPPSWTIAAVADGLFARAARLHALAKLMGDHSGETIYSELATLGDIMERETSALLVLVKRLNAFDVDDVTAKDVQPCI